MTQAHEAAFSNQDVWGEIAELRHGLLHDLVIFFPCIGLLWLLYSLWIGAYLFLPVITSLILIFGSYVVSVINSRSYTVASSLLLFFAVSAHCTALLANVGNSSPLIGVVVVLPAVALLGISGGLLTALAVWAATAVLSPNVSAPTIGSEALITHILIVVTAWLTARPLRRSTSLALSGWSHSREALREVQQRRAELYRVIRALEEATYRIERTNNELVLAQQEAEEARALKSRFVATVSHELRSPLNVILGFSRLMVLSPETYDEPLPAAYRRDLLTVYQNSQHLFALVNDILDLSQIEARQLPLVKDRIDLRVDVIDRALQTVQSLAERKGLWLRVEWPPDLPWVLADPVRLRQALLNLVNNSLRVTAKGGITIRAALTEGSIVVSVEDTGPGIKANDIPKLFREFSDLGAADEEKNSGLGLAITKHLVELHGGDIWVESHDGVGTTFSFAIPLPGAQPHVGHLVRSSNAVGKTLLEPACLVVHSDLDVLRLLARHIEGYHTVGVSDVANLVTFVDDLHPRAIITTPDKGQEISARLALAHHDVPVMMCDMPSIQANSTLDGIMGYLVKPITPDALAAVIHQVLTDGEKTVLLVDDEPDAVRLLEQMLTALPHPYHVVKAYDGYQALDIMREMVPDVIFLDMIMPRLGGAQVLEAMRTDERLAKVPTFAITGKDWIDNSATLGHSIHMMRHSAMSVGEGIACIQAILNALSPDYITSPAASQRPAANPEHLSASEVPLRHQGPAPVAAG